MYRAHVRSALEPKRIAAAAAAVLTGALCGLYYLGRGDFGGTGLYLGSSSLLLAALAPQWAISLAVAEGLGAPLAYAAIFALGLPVAYPPQPHAAAMLLALLPTLAGAMLGLALRRVFHRSSGRTLRR